MISATSSATHTEPVAQPRRAAAQKPPQPAPKPAATTDSVKLSQTAQAMLAALQEATETQAQTGKEASNGDPQAQRLLAKQAARKPVAK